MRRLDGEDGNDVVRAAPSITAFAKTTQPAMGSVVAREALFMRLDEPPGRAVVWISGPPGSGKTTLAASYVAARRFRSVWFELDADDADPATFFHYLRHAVRGLRGPRDAELPAFMAHHNHDVASYARNFFRQVFARAPLPFALVLDNLHSVPAESPLHVALEAGYAQVPKDCCIVVTSRREPPAALARLRATGRMTCVTGNDLALAPDEVVAMAAARGQSISGEAADRLHQRTQGWAAGLVLLLEHSRFSGLIADLPGGATPQVVFDYLAGEIFDRFDATTRDFLLRVACLPRTTAAVAEALTGEPKAARLLVNLALNDYFVREATSEGGRVYHFHPLLSEFLKHRAAQALPEATGPAWLERAATLLRRAGQTEDAVALLVEAGNWNEVALVIATEADALLAQGRSETLAGWLDLLPPRVLAADPRLLQISGVARAHASPRAARQLYERAFAGFRERDDRTGMIESACGTVDAVIAEFDDITPLDRAIETLDALLVPVPGSPPDPRAVATLVRAMLIRDPGHPRLDHWLLQLPGRAGAVSPATPRSDDVAFVQVLVALARGRLDVAGAILESVRSGESTMAAPARLAWALARSLRDLIGGTYADVAQISREALASAHSEGIRTTDPWLSLVAIAARLFAGDLARARDELQHLEANDLRRSRGARGCVHYLRAWRGALGDDPVEAHREAKLALAVAVESGFPWLECLARMAMAQLQAAGIDRHGAEGHLRSAAAIADRMGSPWLQIGMDIVRAEIPRAAQDERTARDRLRDAFRRGREHGLQPPPSLAPRTLADLCAEALRDGVEPDYARALVRGSGLMPRVPPLRIRQWPWRFRITTFGGLALVRNGTPIEFAGKSPGRPLELLKVLIALGRHNVRADQLADALWPNVEADYAHKSFTAALHRLRRMLGDDDAVVLADGRLTLNRTLVWIDTWALEQVCDDIDAALRDADPAHAEDVRRQCIDDVLALYRGPFLPDESEQPSYIACREQARARVLRLLARIARGWEEAGAPEAAIECYLRCIAVDELNEPLHRQLMLCFERKGEPQQAIAVYERLRAVLSARLKLMPSPETQALYANMNVRA